MGDIGRLIPAKPVTHDAPKARSPIQKNFTPILAKTTGTTHQGR